MQKPAIFHGITNRRGKGEHRPPAPQGGTSHTQSQSSPDHSDLPPLNKLLTQTPPFSTKSCHQLSWQSAYWPLKHAAAEALEPCTALSPGGSHHGGHLPLREGPTASQAGCEQLEACFPQAGRQAMLGTHRGKAPPPLRAEAEHSSGCQGARFLLPHDPLGPSCPQHGRRFVPRRPPAQPGLSSPQPRLSLCLPQPQLLPQGSEPHGHHPSLTAPLQGTLLPQEGPRALPSFTPWQSYRARAALPSEDGHFLMQIAR